MMVVFLVHMKKLYIQRQGKIIVTITCLYNIDPLKPHLYIVKLGFTGIYVVFLISAQKRRLWVLVRTAHDLCFEQKYDKYQSFLSQNFQVFGSEIVYIFE